MNGKHTFARAVASRRIELGMRTAKQMAEKSGLSTRLISDIENGRKDNYALASLAAVDDALDWASGTSEHLLRTGEYPDRETSIESAPVGMTWNDFEEAWDSVPVGNSRVLRVFAAYDPDKVDEENLTRIALNARHYMRKELDEASGTGQDSKPAPVTPFPAQPERTVDLNSVAAAPARSEYRAHGDEDELSHQDP